MKNRLFVLLFAIMATNLALFAKEKGDKNTKRETKKIRVVSDIVDAHDMYIYGAAFSPVDSIVYLTDEQKLDGAQMHLKTKFLVSRDELSKQLRNQMLLEGEKNFSCCIVYSQDIKKLDKKFIKQVDYYKKHGFTVNIIGQDRFAFKAVRTEYNENGYATEEIEIPVEE